MNDSFSSTPFFYGFLGRPFLKHSPSFMPFGRIGQEILKISKTLGLEA
jgi:hypothetical protein